MLARVSSGASGIGEYLETGRKRGREFDRDLIDERYTLEGNLALTEAIIDGMTTAQEGDSKYLHITLGFAEEFTSSEECLDTQVNLAKMRQVTSAYRDMLMAAYDPAEYAFYAEAHIPKVTHEINASSGEYEARLPHIHIVIPMRNLESGQYLNPFGYGRATIDFAEAIQEKINADFSLHSPKTASRIEALGAHPLAKHNFEFKEQKTAQQLKQTLREIVASGEVASFEELAAAAQGFGDVKIRQGKEGDYLNIKPAWSTKGINFKELTRQNFEAEAAATKKPQAQPTDYNEIVRAWQSQVAYETRYVTAGFREKYKAMDAAGKATFILQKQQETYHRLNPPLEPYHERPEYERIEPAAYTRVQRAAHLYQSNTAKARPYRTPRSLAGLRNLSSLPVVYEREGVAVLLQPDALDRMGAADGAGPKMRWARTGDIGDVGAVPKKFRDRTLSVAGALQKQNTPPGLSPDKIKNETSPSIVLSDAARRFGIKLSEYSITSAKDGTPRIRHQDRHYNLGDFYTKHIGIPWAQAEEILRECYHATLSNGLPPPDKTLWQAFSAWRERDFIEATAQREATRAQLRKQLVDARNEYKQLKINTRGQKGAARQGRLAKGRAEHVLKVAQIKLLEQQATADAKRPSRNAQYRAYLNEMAMQGDLSALGELRRMAPPDTDIEDTISGPNSKTVLPLPSYKIDHHGKVTYFKDDTAIVTDSVKGVSVVHAEADAYDIALRIAVARYGRDLTFNGDALFMQNMIAAANKSGMDLIIRDADNPRKSPLVIQKQGRGVKR